MSGSDSIPGFLRLREMGIRSGKKKNDSTYFLKKLAEEKAAKPDTNKSFDISKLTRSTMIFEFSPDGKLVASTHGDHSIRVSELSTGKCIQTLTGHPRTPWTLAFHNSYKNVLASGCLGAQVKIWDLKSGGCDSWTFLEDASVCSICFHPIQPLLLIAILDRIYAWNWTVGKPVLFVIAPKPDKIRWLKFHPSGSWLYTGISNGDASSEPSQPPFSSYDNLFSGMNWIRSRLRASRNAGDEADDPEEDNRMRAFFFLEGSSHNLRSGGSRNERSRRTAFASGEREASSAEEDDDEDNDYFAIRSTRPRFIFPPDRHQERRNQLRWRRTTSSYVGLDNEWSRNRRNFESTSSTRVGSHRSSGRVEVGRVRNIWQQRLERRIGGEESRNRSDAPREFSSSLGYDGGSSILEDRVNRRMRSSFLDEPFRSRRDNNEDSEVFGIFGRWPDRLELPSPPEILNRLGNDSVRNLMETESQIQPRISSSPDFSRVLALEVQDGLNRVIRDTMSEDDLNVGNDQPTSSLFSRNSEMSDEFRVEWDNPIQERAQNIPPAALMGTEFLASSSDQFLEESPGDNLPFDILRDLSMPISLDCDQPAAVPPILQLTSPEGHVARQDLEQENRNNGEDADDENTAASGGMLSESRDEEHNTSAIASLGDIDNLHQEVEEQLNDLSGMVELRSRISRLREYLNEMDAAAAPSTSELVISNTSRQISVSSDPTVAEGSLELSVSDDRREDVSHSAAARVQLGTLDDLFVAALGVAGSRSEDHGASTLGGEPVPSCSGSQLMSENGSGSNKTMKEDNTNRKRRRSDDSSDDDYMNMRGLVRRSRHAIFDTDDDCTSSSVRVPLDTSTSVLEQSLEICNTNPAKSVVNGSTAEAFNLDPAMNASFASATTTATTSSTSVIGQVTSNRDAASSTVTNFSVDDDDDDADDDEQNQQSRQQNSITSTRPLAVVFALNSPPTSPPFSFASPSTPRTASSVAPMRSSHNDTFETSPINPLVWGLDSPRMATHLRDEEDTLSETTTDHDYMGHRSNGGRYNSTRPTGDRNSGTDQGGRMSNFMETFFLRRGRGSANRSAVHSSRQPPSYDSVVRNRARIPTPPLSNSSNNNATSSNGSNTRRFFTFSTLNNSSNVNNMSDDDDNYNTNRSDSINSFLNILGQRSSTSRQNLSAATGSSILHNSGASTSNVGASSSYRDNSGTGGSSVNNGRRNLRRRFYSSARRLHDEEEDDEDDDTSRASNDEDFQAPLFNSYSSRTNHIQPPRTRPTQRSRHQVVLELSVRDSGSPSCRIQAWNFLPFECPNLKKTHNNVVVPCANIHNDSTVDISKDGRMLCTFIGDEKSRSMPEVGVFSLETGSLGNCLLIFKLESLAVSVSLSPSNHYLLVGVNPRDEFLPSPKLVTGHIYKLKLRSDNRTPVSAEFYSDITHPCSDWSITSIDSQFAIRVNCARWIQGEGEGLIYGTNKGHLIVFSPKLYNPDLKQRRNGDSQNDRLDMDPFLSWFGAGQRRLDDFRIWSAQNIIDIGPAVV